MLCNYKDIFGKPYVGFHKERFFGYALNDTIGTIIISFIVQHFYYKKTPLIYIFFIIFLFGELCHYIFCVDTQFILNFLKY